MTVGSLLARLRIVRRKNMLLYSEDFTTASWSKASAGTGVTPVATAGSVAPDGSNNATRLQLNKGAGSTTGDYCNVTQGSVATGPNPHPETLSIWLKSNDSNTYQVALRESQAGGTYVVCSVTPAWQRFSLSLAAIASATYGAQLILRGTYGTSNSADILAWGVQSYPGLRLTPYCKTTASAIV